MVHWRRTAEDLAVSGQIAPFVAFDLDMVNFYGSIEWPKIREAMSTHFQESERWTQWTHQQPAVAVTPAGREVASDRGAQQGDGFGAAQASLSLGEARTEAFTEYTGLGLRGSSDPSGVCDQWFVDDGQALVVPAFADAWLRCFDRALKPIGATRGEGNDVKSVARLVCPPGREGDYAGWDTAYIRNTCKVKTAAEGAKVLGTYVGSQAALRAHVETVAAEAARTRDAITEVDHPATEMVLTRKCTDVSKLTYLLRTSGDLIDTALLENFDVGMKRAVETILGGSLQDAAWWQATIGVRYGGLGMREATAVVFPAFLGSRLASRPLVKEMAGHMEAAGLGTEAQVMDRYDERTRSAFDRFANLMPEGIRPQLATFAEEAAADAQASWELVRRGQTEADAMGARRGPGAALLPEAGDEDEEHPHGNPQGCAMRLQAGISKIVDDCVRTGLVDFCSRHSNGQDSGGWMNSATSM